MYCDLRDRSSSGAGIDYETFVKNSPLSSLWTNRIFLFIKNQNLSQDDNYINFQEFILTARK